MCISLQHQPANAGLSNTLLPKLQCTPVIPAYTVTPIPTNASKRIFVFPVSNKTPGPKPQKRVCTNKHRPLNMCIYTSLYFQTPSNLVEPILSSRSRKAPRQNPLIPPPNLPLDLRQQLWDTKRFRDDTIHTTLPRRDDLFAPRVRSHGYDGNVAYDFAFLLELPYRFHAG